MEIKDTITTCKIVEVEEETPNSGDGYVPNSEKEGDSDTDSKKAQTYQELVSFDPEKQNTNYNGKSVPINIEVVKINEKLAQTASYMWMARYECVPTTSAFNSFLNVFKNRHSYP